MSINPSKEAFEEVKTVSLKCCASYLTSYITNNLFSFLQDGVRMETRVNKPASTSTTSCMNVTAMKASTSTVMDTTV